MDSWDSTTGIVSGFGILNNMDIVCGGFEYPNVLKQTTPDGWCIVIKKEKRKNYKKAKVDSDVLYLYHSTFNTMIEVDNTPYGFDRAYGFSDTGNSFVLASSSDLIIWTKEGGGGLRRFILT